MLRVDEDAVICDFAETYHVYDLYALEPGYAATLAAGLRDSSRIKMRLSGLRVTPEAYLLACVVDRLSMILWSRSKDGQRNRNRPKMLTDQLSGEKKTSGVKAFSDGSAFDRAKAQILAQIKGDQHA